MKTFNPPNFRCRVSENDVPAKKITRLVYAADAKAAHDQLEGRDYIVHRVRPYDFNDWIKATKRLRAAAARARSGANPAKWKPHTFREVWKPLKEVLLDLFDGKCAYCDASFAHVAWGDVEHFRPKAEVSGELAHPGYYWLAYEPDNYLPSCQRCNQGGAKMNQFPVAGTRATGPTDPLDKEDALLLNPYKDDFRQHLKFHPSTDLILAGTVEARPGSTRGATSIDVYRLKRKNLVDIRRKEQAQALIECKQVYANWIQNDVDVRGTTLVQECLNGRRQFSSAVIDEIEAFAASRGLPSPFA